MLLLLLLALFDLLSAASAQLLGRVGPTTSTASKRAARVCNVLDYGGVANRSADVGPALSKAFAACRGAGGGTLYVPPGEYGMATWVVLSGGEGWALQLDGVIYRTGTQGGHMIHIQRARDVEVYSRTSQGAIQGHGYEFHRDNKNGCRLVRMSDVQDFSVHDLALVDAPLFHLFLKNCTNGEVYNMIIRGGNKGGLDGLDVSGSNMWIHDVEVSNRDECVTIKNPAKYMLIENIYCNWSGGCALGSLGAGTDIHHIHYDKIYSANCNQMLMIKSNGGSGEVHDCAFTNFIGRHNAYTLNVDAHWTQLRRAPGDGILFRGLNISGWHGSCSDGARRGPVNMICPEARPCRDILLADFAIWTESGSRQYYKCANAYGQGACLRSGSGSSGIPAAYSVSTVTVTQAPSGWAEAPTMAADLTNLPLSSSIPIPPVPTSFFPGATPYSRLLGAATRIN